MKRNVLLSLVSLCMLWITACGEKDKIYLFNGSDLDNWNFFVNESGVKMNDVFWVDNGLLHVAGIPNGYIRTKETYDNFRLHVEWRWTAEPKNSGVMIHVQGEDMTWPLAVECQLMDQHAGDIVLIGKGSGITIRDTVFTVTSEENRILVIPKLENSSENPPGEWNTYDITTRKGEMKVKVNGVLQNQGRDMTLLDGNILIQSEGGPMEFRNIWLIPL